MTQEEVAHLLATDKSTISRLESGRQRGNFEWLERYAAALKVRPVSLFRLPTQPSLDELVESLPEDQRRLITRMIESAIADAARRD
jgi:transcriptional regulator with XRE-family HTH domain